MSANTSNKRRKHSPHAKSMWISGFHDLQAQIRQAPENILDVWLDEARHDDRMSQLRSQLDELNIQYKIKNNKEISKIVKIKNQGVIGHIKIKSPKSDKDLSVFLETSSQPLFILVLDQITDPHNLGACLRTADGAGVDAIILPKDNACPLNETVRRVASGAAESMLVFYVSNLARALKQIKQHGVWLVGLANQASNDIRGAELKLPLAVVLGSEGKGLRRLTCSLCDELVRIPMKGSVSSLNVSVATGIVLYSI